MPESLELVEDLFDAEAHDEGAVPPGPNAHRPFATNSISDSHTDKRLIPRRAAVSSWSNFSPGMSFTETMAMRMGPDTI